MKIKTSELERAALDWAVAITEGYELDPHRPTSDRQLVPRGQVANSQNAKLLSELRYSTDWSRGGPLIAKKITVLIDCETGCHADTWAKAGIYGQPFSEYDGQGPTLLIAAMRSIVASEIGDEVEVPDEIAEAL